MTLDQLYYFKKLAELEHYTNAATELYISQPSLSLSIKNLEDELGTSLFQKKERNVVLTSNGEAFYKCVIEVLNKLNEGVSTLKQNVDSSYGKINIGTVPALSSNLLSENIKSFIRFFPHTKLDIFTCLKNKDVIKGILDGAYNVGFCFNPENEKDLAYVPVLKQELVVITNVGHKLSYKDQIIISDLSEYPLITYRESNPLGNFIRKAFKEQNIVPNIIFSFDESITISEMVTQDFGIGIIANIPILNHYLPIMPLYFNIDLPVLYLAYLKNANHSKAIREFVHLLNASATI